MKKRLIGYMLAVALVLPILMAPVAYGWGSFFGENWGVVTPVHEDITQAAYSRLAKMLLGPQGAAFSIQDSGEPRTYDSGSLWLSNSGEYQDSGVVATALSAGAPKSNLELMRATNDAEYAERVKFLRIGAFWNDQAANNVFDWGYAFARRNDVAKYPKTEYATAYDVGEHLQLTLDQNYSRAMVRMSMNERGEFIHSMLVAQPGNGSKFTYMTQEQTKEFVMQWLEVVYKFASGQENTLNAEQKKLLTFIDPYGQRSSGSGSGFADMKLTEDQARLRALGSMCHTLEDSFNPAHTIRSYYQGGDGDVGFGTILAFGDYSAQGNFHMQWDSLAGTDSSLRKELVNNTGNFTTAMKYQTTNNIGEKVQSFRTLGLYNAWDAAYTLMQRFAEGQSWEELKPWLEESVFKTHFKPDGNSYIYDTGRRAADAGTFEIQTIFIRDAIKRSFAGKTEMIKLAEELDKTKYDFRNMSAKVYNYFYNTKEPKYFYHTPYEKENRQLILNMLDQMRRLVVGATPEQRRIIREEWDTLERTFLQNRVQMLGGLAQEMSFDLMGVPDPAASANVQEILNLLKTEAQTETGIVAAMDGDSILLRNQKSNNISRIMTGELPLDGPMLAVGQTVTVKFDVTGGDRPGEDVTYTAREIKVDDKTTLRTTKGVLRALSETSLTLDADGDVDNVTMALKDAMTVPDGIFVGDSVMVTYTVTNGKLTAQKVQRLNRDGMPKELAQGEVTLLGADSFSVQRPLPTEEDELIKFMYGEVDTYTVIYGNADIIGTPAVGEKVSVLYQALGGPSDDETTVIASRIISENHTHGNYVYNAVGDQTHWKICADLDESTLEPCSLDGVERCTLCGARASYIEAGGKQYSWSAAELQKAITAAASGATVKLVPRDGVSTLLLDTVIEMKKPVKLALEGTTLQYNGAGPALSVGSAGALTLENGAVFATDKDGAMCISQQGSTVLSGVTLQANGYTVDGGTLTIESALPGGKETSIRGGGLQMDTVALRLNSTPALGDIAVALPANATLPMQIAAGNGYTPTAEDISHFNFGTKNEFTGAAAFAIVGTDVKLLPLAPAAPQGSETINGGDMDGRTFEIGKQLVVKAAAYSGNGHTYTPSTWSINPSGSFTKGGGSYTATIETAGFTPGDHTLTMVYSVDGSSTNLAAATHTIGFTGEQGDTFTDAASKLEFQLRQINGKTAAVVVGTAAGAPNAIVVPAKVTYKGVAYEVLAIDANAFTGNTAITSVTLPSGITALETGTFRGCSQLRTVRLTGKPPRIGVNTFDALENITFILASGSRAKAVEQIQPLSITASTQSFAFLLADPISTATVEWNQSTKSLVAGGALSIEASGTPAISLPGSSTVRLENGASASITSNAAAIAANGDLTIQLPAGTSLTAVGTPGVSVTGKLTLAGAGEYSINLKLAAQARTMALAAAPSAAIVARSVLVNTSGSDNVVRSDLVSGAPAVAAENGMKVDLAGGSFRFIADKVEDPAGDAVTLGLYTDDKGISREESGAFAHLYVYRATPGRFTITSAAGANGSISPEGVTQVAQNGSQRYEITANSGYVVDAVYVDGAAVLASGMRSFTYTFQSVTQNHDIFATFRPTGGGGGSSSGYTTHFITATAGEGGAISPAGELQIRQGGMKTFTITPNQGYAVKDVKIDGISKGALTTYVFEDIQGDHTIAAEFQPSAVQPAPSQPQENPKTGGVKQVAPGGFSGKPMVSRAPQTPVQEAPAPKPVQEAPAQAEIKAAAPVAPAQEKDASGNGWTALLALAAVCAAGIPAVRYLMKKRRSS